MPDNLDFDYDSTDVLDPSASSPEQVYNMSPAAMQPQTTDAGPEAPPWSAYNLADHFNDGSSGSANRSQSSDGDQATVAPYLPRQQGVDSTSAGTLTGPTTALADTPTYMAGKPDDAVAPFRGMAYNVAPEDMTATLDALPKIANRDYIGNRLGNDLNNGTLEETAKQNNSLGKAAQRLLARIDERAPATPAAQPSPDTAMPGALPASNDMRAAPHEADAPDDATPNSRNIDGAQGNVTVESNPTPAANALGASTLHGANGDIDEIVANAARAYSADPGQQFAQQANWDRSLQSGLREQALIGGLQNQFGRMANDSIAESRAQDVALKQALGPEFAASANGALAQQRAQHAAKAAAAARLDAARNAAGLDFGRGANDWSDDAAPIDFGNRSASWSDGDASPSMLDRAKSVAKWADQPIGWLDDVRKTAQRGNEQIGDALNALGLHGLADAHGAWGDLTGSSMPTRPWELALSAAPYAGKAGPLLREGATAFGPQIERMFERAVPSLRVNMVPDGPSFGPASPEGSSPKSASPEGSSSTPAYPDGLAYRTDLARHLIGPDGFKQSGALHGTHNLENAKAALDRKNATYNLNPTGTNGISELGYQYTKPNGSVVKESKTVYDPSVFSDQAMLDLSQRVGQRAYEAYLKDPSKTRADLSEGGMNLRAYINIDRKTGLPYVGNVHPLGD